MGVGLSELLQFTGKQGRGQVPAANAQIPMGVGKGDLDDQCGKLIGPFPDAAGRASIAGVHDGPVAAGDAETDCRHGMVDLDGRDRHAGDLMFLSRIDGVPAEDAVVDTRKSAEIGPYLVIEQMLLHRLENWGGADYLNRVAEPIDQYVFGQVGNSLDVVQMRMGDQHGADRPLLFHGQGAADGARIQQHFSVHKKGW